MRLALALAAGIAWLAGTSADAGCLRGINIAGAEFGKRPGRAGFDYVYPSGEAIARLAATGGRALRLPFLWERLQPVPGGPLDPGELALIDGTIRAARAAGLTIILDPHNYAYHGTARIGSPALPIAQFADLWSRLARHVRREPGIVLSLMNEPKDIGAETWLEAANAAIAAIRTAGARQLVLVPGTGWTGAHSWEADLPTGNNSAVMLRVRDPSNNFAYDVHQYLDADFSGTKPECSGAARAAEAIDRMSAWLTRHDRRAFLGEFGASDRPECVAGLTALVSRVEAAPARWVGWTAWAAGAFWAPDYPLSLEPGPTGAERPQMRALRTFFRTRAADSRTPERRADARPADARPPGSDGTCRSDS